MSDKFLSFIIKRFYSAEQLENTLCKIQFQYLNISLNRFKIENINKLCLVISNVLVILIFSSRINRLILSELATSWRRVIHRGKGWRNHRCAQAIIVIFWNNTNIFTMIAIQYYFSLCIRLVFLCILIFSNENNQF